MSGAARSDRPDLRAPAEVVRIARRLQDAGFDTWAVGGAVRDALAGRVPGDWDLTTAARPLNPPLSLPLPSSATPSGPKGVAREMLLSATSRTISGSSKGLPDGGGSNLSIWPQLTLPSTSRPRSRTPRATTR